MAAAKILSYPRVRNALLTLTALLLLLTLSPARTGNARMSRRPPASPFTAQASDSVVVYGPTQFEHSNANSSLWESSTATVNADSTWGWRYVLEIVNGPSRVTGATFRINGREFVGTSECGSSTASLLRVIDVAGGNNDMDFAIKGVQGSRITVRIVRVKEPAFTVFGRKTYVRPAVLSAQADTFIVPDDGAGPFTLWVINGDTVGTAHRMTNATISVNGSQVMNSSDFGTGRATATRQVSLYAADDVQNFVSLYNQSASGTRATLWFTATGTLEPQLVVTSPAAETTYTEAAGVRVQGSVSDHLKGWLTTTGGPSHETPCAFSDSIAFAGDGVCPIALHALNGGGFGDTTTRVVFRDTQAPVITFSSPLGDTTVAAGGAGTDSLSVIGTCSDLTLRSLEVDGEPLACDSSGHFRARIPLDLGPNGSSFTGKDAFGRQTTAKRFAYNRPVETRAIPDTSATATGRSGVSTTQATAFRSAMGFLYRGSSPVQSGLDTTILVPGHEAVVRGVVVARDFGPLPNVHVSVLGYGSFGSTWTAVDGSFNLMVNSGAPLVLRFVKDGFLEAQRAIEPMAEDFAHLDTLALIGRSGRNMVINTMSADSLSVAGRFESDANGGRRLALIFNPGTRCLVTRQNRDTTSFTRLHVRAKEYTVGRNGPGSMPAALPPTSAYTYCVNLSVDEAEAFASGDNLPPEVRFDQPVAAYVQEFLNLPLGSHMPSGYYDPAMGSWVASEDGVVLKIVAAPDGLAEFDVDSDGAPDSSVITNLGISTDERREVAKRFAVGDSVWRMPLRHFSAQDFNLNIAALTSAGSRLAADASGGWQLVPRPDVTCGCLIEDENRVLGETIPVQGTPFSLHYRSNRQPGDLAMRTLTIPLLGDSIPLGLSRIRLRIFVAGHAYKQDFDTTAMTPNMTHPFHDWDGSDVFGRPVNGSVNATIQIGYEYIPRLTVRSGGGGSPGVASSEFGSTGQIAVDGGTVPSGERGTIGRVFWFTQRVAIGAPSMESAGLNGWTITPHHYYDTNGHGTLWLGDGDARTAYRPYPLIRRFAGSGGTGVWWPDTTSDLLHVSVCPTDMAFDSDGSLLVSDGVIGKVWRIKNGKRYTVAGIQNTDLPYDHDGQPATQAPLHHPGGIAVGPDHSIYLTDYELHRLFRITPDGLIHTFAGNGWQGNPGEDSLATDTRLNEPISVAVGPDGSVFVGDRDGSAGAVYRIDPRGYIRRYAGNGQDGHGQGANVGQARQTAISEPSDLAVDPQGNLYISEWLNNDVRQVAPDGRITQYADGASINLGPTSLAFGPDGLLRIAQGGATSQGLVRREADGRLTQVAGGYPPFASYGPDQDGALARGVRFYGVAGLAVDAHGDAFLGQSNGYGISRIYYEQPIVGADSLILPSEDGREEYVFSTTGRHLRTRDAITGVVMYRFGYADGHLTSITDADNLVTRIARNAQGQADSIIAPFGQVTTLARDGSQKHLAQVMNFGGDGYAMDYDGGGLLQHMANPRQKTWSYHYGSNGRLETESDPAGGGNELATQEGYTRLTVTRTSAEGRVNTYTVDRMVDGLRRRLVQWPGRPEGAIAIEVDSMVVPATDNDSLGEVDRTVSPDGVLTLTRPTHDSRYGWMAAVPKSSVTTLPVSHLARTQKLARRWDANGHTWQEILTVNNNEYHAVYDADPRRLTLTTGTAGRQRTVDFDAAGHPTAFTFGRPEEAPRDPLRVAYDAQGRLDSLAQAGRSWKYAYDDRGRLLTARDPEGGTTTYRYDAADRESSVTLPGNRVVRYRWDANGNLLGLTPPGKPEHAFAYTDVDLNQAYTPPPIAGVADPSTRYEFNRDRQLERVTRPDGGEIELHYGATTGRLESLSQPRGSTLFTYSSSTGQLAGVTSPDSVTTSYTYDGPFLSREVWSGRVSGAVAHGLNNDFLESSQTVVVGADSSTVSYGHDADGFLTSATIDGVEETIHRRSADGLVDWTTVGGVRSEHSYDNHGELSQLSYTWPGGGSFVQDIGRDALGRVDSLVESGVVSHASLYHYDPAGRLASVWRDGVEIAGYEYDDNGNRLVVHGAETVPDSVDAQDRLVLHGNTSFEYTAAGELLRRIVPADPSNPSPHGGIPYDADTTTYTYDALGNLLGVSTWADTMSYMVDGQHRRVEREHDGTRTGGWLYQNGLNVIAELDSAGALRSRYVYATQGHVPDLMVHGDSTYRLITDQLGSVRAVVNVASGRIVQRADYDAWGVATLDSLPDFQSLGYAGGLMDRATGLIRFGARDYDPSVGRWTCKDPVGFAAASLNLYGYVEASPLVGVDPTGLWPYHKNWGGPHWTNGKDTWGESEHFPHLPGQPGYVPAFDARDELYREHDVDLMHCARIIDHRLRQQCRRDADLDLAAKLWRFRKDHPGCDDWSKRLAEVVIFAVPNPWTPGGGPGEYVP